MTSNATTPKAHAPALADDAAIRSTIDDYYLGWFDADGERMARALHPELAKRGWIRIGTAEPIVDADTFETMVELAGAGRGRRTEPKARAFTVDVTEVFGDIATAVVHAVPYVDYLHLVRTPSGWRILNALWCPA